MEYHFMCKILIFVLISEEIAPSTVRQKRSNIKFNALLNLYKMSPLRNSNVFRTFSNTVLLPNRDDGPHAMNLDSNESVKRKEKNTIVELKLIEDKIHVTRSPRIIIGQPEYKLPNDQLELEEFSKPTYSLKDLTNLRKAKDNQEIVLYEFDGRKQKVTKMLPIDKIPLYVDKNMVSVKEKTERPVTTKSIQSRMNMFEQMDEMDQLDRFFSDASVIVI